MCLTGSAFTFAMTIIIIIIFFFEEKVGEKLSGTQDRDPGTCDPWTRYPVNQNSETRTLGHGTLTPRTPELGPWNLGYVTLKPRILRVGP